MRALVIGDSLDVEDGRMRLAAAGLALRGHQVLWQGVPPRLHGGAAAEQPPEGAGGRDSLRPVRGGLWLSRNPAEVVIGGGRSLARTAAAGWLAGAHAMVLALEPGGVAAWSRIDRWCWESLDGYGIAEAAPSDVLSSTSSAVEREHLSTWSGEVIPASPAATHPDTEILERLGERARARRRGRGPLRAVFLDRDGTLVREKGYLAAPAELEILSGATGGLRRLLAAGFALVVISNQAGVGRGLFPLSRVHEVMARLRVDLREHGVELDGVYFCPHRPDQGCACRKPGVALLERAASDLGISLRDSVMIGDKLIDVAAGQRAGGLGILVRTGYGAEEERSIERAELSRPPDQVCDDLAAAVEWILDHRGWGRMD